MRRRTTGLFAAFALCVPLAGGLPAVPASAKPAVDKRVGHGNDGLVSAKGRHVPHCADHMKVAVASGICVHGADAGPEGRDVTVSRTVAELRSDAYDGAPPTEPATVPGVSVPTTDGGGVVVCEGDGTSGKRIQVLYVRAADVASRFVALRDTLEQNVLFADQEFNASAAQTGGARHMRLVTDSDGHGGCALDIKEVVVPAPVAPATFSFGYSVQKVSEAGYSDKSRKYLMLTDADYLCGVGSMYIDDKAGANNLSNYYAPEYARVDTGCWHYAEAHELMHNMGGVQDSAPHASQNGHCYDESEIMCYSDGGSWFTSGGALQQICPANQEDFFDCGKDDYFSTSPVAGSYLSNHWNAATSAYLIQPAVAASNTVHITAPANQSSSFGTAVAPVQVVATDVTPGQVLTYAAAGLPAGLSISPSTGVISGAPTAVGPATVVITAADGINAAGSATFTWAVAAVAPPAPTGLVVTPGRRSLSLSWSAPANDGGSALTSYDVTVTPAGGAPATTSTGTTQTTRQVTGLVNDTTYAVTVAATNALGTGSATGPAEGTPTAVAPMPPTGVLAQAGDGSASVSFVPPVSDGDSPITGYTVTASTGQQKSGASSPIVLTGLANSTSRTFTVQAVNAKGASVPSSASNAVTFWNSALTVSPVSGVVTSGSTITLSGALSTGAPGGRALSLVVTTAGQPTRTVPLTTASNGTWKASLKLTYTTYAKVVYAGDSTHRAGTSAVSKWAVRTLVTITSPTQAQKTTTRTLKVTGRTSPNKAGTTVTLWELRSGKLYVLTTAKVSSTGTFVLTRTFAKGTHQLVVSIPATSTNAAATSATRTVYEV